MGNATSSHKQHHDGTGRPLKRRKIDSIFGTETSIVKTLDGDDDLPPHGMSDEPKDLRLQVLQVIPKSSARTRVAASHEDDVLVLQTRALCAVTLSHEPEPGQREVLQLKREICTLKSFRNAARTRHYIRVCLPEAFFFSQKDLSVFRPGSKDIFLADAYTATFELSSIGEEWPPLDLEVLTRGTRPNATTSQLRPPESCSFYGELREVFGKGRGMVPLQLKSGPSSIITTDFHLDVDARWKTNILAKISDKPSKADPLCSLPAFDETHHDIGPGVFATPRKGAAAAASAQNDRAATEPTLGEDDEDPEEAPTPGRSLRTRNNTTYNLKKLSDQAQGKERKRRKRKLASMAEHDDLVKIGNVTYEIPTHSVPLDSFRCLVCARPHASLELLQHHFEYHHLDYELRVKSSAPDALVQLVHRYEYPDLGGTGTRGILKSTKTTRNSSQQARRGESSSADSAVGDLGSSVEAPISTGGGGADTRTNSNRPTLRDEFVVPETKTPLYHPVSRMPLKPGTIMKRPVPDDSWLIQWHRDAIAEFTDITTAERQYLTAWNDFMLPRRITSEIYLPEAWIAFICAKGDWFLSAKDLIDEFSKHLTYLIARDVLNDRDIQEGFKLIREKKAALGFLDQDPPATLAPGPKKAPSKANCQICDESVVGPRMLICASKDCDARLYHKTCVRSTAKMDVTGKKWLCNPCVELRNEQ